MISTNKYIVHNNNNQMATSLSTSLSSSSLKPKGSAMEGLGSYFFAFAGLRFKPYLLI
jgi:hypothetical protein